MTLSECIEALFTLFLRLLTMDERRSFAGFSQVLVQMVHVRDQIDEDNDWCLLVAVQNLHQSGLALAIVRHKLNLLFDCFLVADFTHLDKSRELKVLASHFFNQWLHGGTEHEKGFVAVFTRDHLLFLLLDHLLIITLVQMLGDLANDGIDRVLQVVIYHFVGLVKHDKVALVQHKSTLSEEVFYTTRGTDDDLDTARYNGALLLCRLTTDNDHGA